MNRFIIVDGLPYLYADKKAYSVRWNEEGFTVGEEIELDFESNPITFPELSIKAKCAGNLDSIGKPEPQEEQEEQKPNEPKSQEPVQQETKTQEQPEATKPIEEMMVVELKNYAKKYEISLGSAKTKAEIIDVIKAAEE